MNRHEGGNRSLGWSHAKALSREDSAIGISSRALCLRVNICTPARIRAGDGRGQGPFCTNRNFPTSRKDKNYARLRSALVVEFVCRRTAGSSSCVHGRIAAVVAGRRTAPLSVRKLGDPGRWRSWTAIRRCCGTTTSWCPNRPRSRTGSAPAIASTRWPARDYIHPLYGPRGEVLTEDWSPDHPHHRGIYWAWPEVDWQGQRGDLHALQLVFARPTGKFGSRKAPIRPDQRGKRMALGGPDADRPRTGDHPRACRQTAAGRAIDLQFRFTALDADVQVARRGTSHYGGLNVRLSARAISRSRPSAIPPAQRPPRLGTPQRHTRRRTSPWSA